MDKGSFKIYNNNLSADIVAKLLTTSHLVHHLLTQNNFQRGCKFRFHLVKGEDQKSYEA